MPVGTNNLYKMPKPFTTQKLLDELNERLVALNELLEDFGQTEYTFDQYERIFSNYGWYIPFDLMIKDVSVIVNQFENNEIQKANKFLIKHFKKNLKKIKSYFIETFPERKNVFIEAFDAHNEKMYFSSTILFLSQADGITENKIFMGKNFREFSKENIDHPLVVLFKEKNPLTEHVNPNHNEFIDLENLNRHGVIHGLSNNYGRELNSYKALSFLWFVSNFRNKTKL